MIPVYYRLINNKLTPFRPTTVAQILNVALRIDWEDCYSSMLKENFVIHLS